MPNFLSYYDAATDEPLQLDDSQVKCWVTDRVARATGVFGYQQNPGLRRAWIDCLNKAFEVYSTARTNLKKYPDANRREAMVKELKEAADAGWWYPGGPTSLKQAIEYVSGKHRWDYGSTDHYHHQPWSVYETPVNGPRAAIYFFEAFDEKNKEGVEACAEFQGEIEELKQIADKGRPTEHDAKRAAERMEQLKEAHKKAERLLWWTGKGIDYADTFTRSEELHKVLEVAEKCHKGAEKFAKAFDKGLKVAEGVQDAFELYENGKNAGLSEGAAATIGVLAVVMKKVPILGEAYGAALASVPGIAKTIQDHADELKIAMQRLNLE